MNKKVYNNRGKKIQLRHRQNIKDIEKDLIQGIPYSDLSKKYDVNISSLSRYKEKYLSKKVNKYSSQKDYRDAEELWNTVNKNINRTTNLIESIQEYLQDPENPDKIDVAPQSTDTYITYYDTDGIKKKDTLQNIIDNKGIDAVKVEISTPDRVKTLIEAIHVLNKQLHLVGDFKGMIGNTVINIANQPMFVEFVQAVVKVLQPWPEAKQQLITEVRQLSKLPLLDVDPNTVIDRNKDHE